MYGNVLHTCKTLCTAIQMSWKTWKITNLFPGPENVLEFYKIRKSEQCYVCRKTSMLEEKRVQVHGLNIPC